MPLTRHLFHLHVTCISLKFCLYFGVISLARYLQTLLTSFLQHLIKY
nr:MAG TPA: hypothetical protein [Siphoviridae sp. ctHmS4]